VLKFFENSSADKTCAVNKCEIMDSTCSSAYTGNALELKQSEGMWVLSST